MARCDARRTGARLRDRGAVAARQPAMVGGGYIIGLSVALAEAAERPRRPAQRRRKLVKGGAHSGVVPDVAGVGPLAAAVDADHGGPHLGVGDAEVGGQRAQRVLPEAVFLAVG